MDTLSAMNFDWVSHEREKYIWEDMYTRSWDEIIGRVYLLKAHSDVENERYTEALADFEQALELFSKNGVNKDYYYRALADKALVQCLLAQYQAALSTLDQAFAHIDEFYRDSMLNNRKTILTLIGTASDPDV